MHKSVVLKSDPRTAHIPVIFLTNLSDEDDEKTGLEAGAIDYIAKPFRLPIVKARVRNHLELKRCGDLLEQLAGLDGLTGIANRRRFDDMLAAEWRRAQRHNSPLALVMIDIDFFKAYNDHSQGDDCLRKVARTMSMILRRATDFLARYGGEEFAVILADTALDEATLAAEHLRSQVEEQVIPHSCSQIASCVTISLGIAADAPNGNNSAAELLAAADAALYRAKGAGRNRVER